MRSFNKIFGIGRNKTGTASLSAALHILGIPSIHNPGVVEKAIELERQNGKPLLSTLSQYKAFFDDPISYIYKELDILYPGSLFIYTVRRLDNWIASQIRFQRICHQPDDCPEHLAYEVDVKALIADYEAHDKDVREYFKDRPKDFLMFNICGKEGWKELCTFLKCDILTGDFPWLNNHKP